MDEARVNVSRNRELRYARCVHTGQSEELTRSECNHWLACTENFILTHKPRNRRDNTEVARLIEALALGSACESTKEYLSK